MVTSETSTVPAASQEVLHSASLMLALSLTGSSDRPRSSHSLSVEYRMPALGKPDTLMIFLKTLGTGLSFLFYNNSTWIKAIVDTSCRWMQKCWGKTMFATGMSGRYALFVSSSAPVKTELPSLGGSSYFFG